MEVPYIDLVAQAAPLRDELLAAVERVLAHGQYILGPEVEELESRLAELLGVPHVVTVHTGTDALMLGLRLAGVGPGDEVVTASHSFVATASAIEMLGARTVFADIDRRTMVLAPAAIERALTARTRAVVPVHLNGYPCEIDRIAELCRDHGVALVEDCAQAFGARLRSASVGSLGIGCFSLHPLKVLSACGDGGFLTVGEGDAAERLRRMRNLGLVDRDHCGEISGNTRLDSLQAALVLVKLRRVRGWIEARREHARRYLEALSGLVELPPGEDETHSPIWSAFVIRHPERDRLREELRRAGIDSKVHYPIAIHRQAAFAHRAPFPSLPETERSVARILSLPVSPELTVEGRERIVGVLRRALGAEA